MTRVIEISCPSKKEWEYIMWIGLLGILLDCSIFAITSRHIIVGIFIDTYFGILSFIAANIQYEWITIRCKNRASKR